MKDYLTEIIQMNQYTTLKQCLKCELNRSARRNRAQKVTQNEVENTEIKNTENFEKVVKDLSPK